MDNKNLMQGNVTIKNEPISPKKVVLSGGLIPPHAIKKETMTRLPSFKPPRDLSLCGSTTSQSVPNLNFLNAASKTGKKVYMPNINVVRRKGSNTASSNESLPQIQAKNKTNKDAPKKPPPNKKRNANVVQTQGVFSEGLAPGKVKAYQNSYERAQSETGIMDKPKLNLNRKIVKKNEDSKLKSLLKDDFVDDPNHVPDITFIPNSLPIVYNVKNKQHDSHDIEKTFEYLHVKSEKIGITKAEDLKLDPSDVLSTFEESSNPRMLLFDFPSPLPNKEDLVEKKKSSKNQLQNDSENTSKAKPGSLSSLGEGLWGCLRIHENGKAYFVFGKNVMPVTLSRHLSRQDVMSTSVDPSKNRGEVINLGTVDATFTCSTNFFQD